MRSHHGYYHENPTLINRDTERRLMDLAFATYKKHFGIRPSGYRSPYWDYSENTLDLVIEEARFLYDSSLMAETLCHIATALAGELGDGQRCRAGEQGTRNSGGWYLGSDFPAL